ncbi:MAG: hypothetical protein ABSC06_11820 [Rhodopila sp.]
MDKAGSDDSASQLSAEYAIYGQPGDFTANFRSPYNSIHQISGFKTEDDARAWIAETKLLVSMYT